MDTDELETFIRQGRTPVRALTDEGYRLVWNTDLDLGEVESFGV
jgi:hypothetical protein